MVTGFDVTAIGELLVDFTQNGVSGQGNPLFEANPGGAPCNVLAMLRKLGKRCAFIGKIGKDGFGDMLAETAEEAGIDISCLLRDEEVHTTLAVVHTYPDGDRDFSFYRKPGADIMLRPEEVDEEMVASSKIFHYGSVSMTDEPCCGATKKAIGIAKEAGRILSFDPNLRPPLWDTEEHAKEEIRWGLAQCDVAKIADNELLFLTGEEDFDAGAAILRKAFPNIRLLCVTAGKDGSYCYYKDLRAFEPACSLGSVIETTGAGDTFCASVLGFVLDNGLEALTEAQLHEMLRFANTAAYIVTTKKGAIRAMPSPEEVREILKKC